MLFFDGQIKHQLEDLFGQALSDHYSGIKAKLWIYNQYGPKEEMPLGVYFRDEDEMPGLELIALQHCKGKVLDIGAGAGSHALILQRNGFDVTAFDISAKAVEIMRDRGVAHAIQGDIFEFKKGKYDTLLLMMNGIGLAGTIEQFKVFLKQAVKLLNPGGQLLFDSSDIAYLYDYKIPYTGNYHGEIAYQYRYKGKKTEWFKWLYIDKNQLAAIANADGWKVEVLFEDDMDQYLARLTLINK